MILRVDGEESKERFRYDEPFIDPDGILGLSSSQIAAGAVWKRPRELIIATSPSTESNSATADSSKPIVVIRRVDPLSVSQELVSDCSFVCSLCIAAEYEKKFKKQLITKIIFPQNSRGIPVYNAYGKYMVKLFLNGAYRKVVVDDLLPVDTENKLLCSSAEYTPSSMELWVSIIEKAYMKVNGGYDFPGSNSGIDLYALTGWIPEQVFFAEDAQQPERNRPYLDHRQSEDR
jgi:calpain-7